MLKMDRSTLLYGYAIGATILVIVLLYFAINLMEWYNSEPIIQYEIDAPTPPSNGKAIEKPSIKV